MIIGIGTDIASIVRFQDNIEKLGERFADKILSESEKPAYNAHKQQAQFLASRFAAKEAAAKALGTGFRDGLTLKDISVVSNPIGRPEIILSGQAAILSDSLGVASIHLSISHERDFALAFVVVSGTSAK